MNVLLSLCNQPRAAREGVLLFDLEEKRGSWIPVGTDSEIMGTRGICVHGSLLYVCYTVGWWETHVSVYEMEKRKPRLLSDHLLPEVKDPHSACVYEDRLLVASTGTDEIIAYDVSGAEVADIAETFWRASSEGEDTHHVNSVYAEGERVVVSAFGPRSGEFWSSAQNGYILDLTSGRTLQEALRHPHGVRLDGERVYFTESSTQSLRVIGEQPVIIGGYARGCDVAPDGSLLVGSNAARRVSRSRGIVENSSNLESREGPVVGKCSIARVTMRDETAARVYYDVTPFGKEIYDIRVLP